jgi:hypothetical protein
LFALLATPACVAPAPDEPAAATGEARYESLKQRTSIVVDFPTEGLVVGSNQLKIRVDPSWGGQPASVQLAGVSGFMPAHSHNRVEGQVSAQPADYSVGGLDLPMPGHWQFTAHVIRDAGQATDSDDVTFDVLVR